MIGSQWSFCNLCCSFLIFISRSCSCCIIGIDLHCFALLTFHWLPVPSTMVWGFPPSLRQTFSNFAGLWYGPGVNPSILCHFQDFYRKMVAGLWSSELHRFPLLVCVSCVIVITSLLALLLLLLLSYGLPLKDAISTCAFYLIGLEMIPTIIWTGPYENLCSATNHESVSTDPPPRDIILSC